MNMFRQCFDPFQPRGKSRMVRNLDRQSRTRVQLQQQGTALFVDHNIRPEITEFNHVGTARRKFQMLFPERNPQFGKTGARIGMNRDRYPALNRHTGTPVFQGKPDPDSALMQVRPPIRLTRRQADHRHHGITAEHDHPHIGDSLKAVITEHIRKMNTLFDQRIVHLPAQTVQTAENIGNGSVDLPARKHAPVVLDEPPFRMVADHQNAASAGTVSGLDYEPAFHSANHGFEILHVMLTVNRPDQSGTRNPRFLRQTLRQQFVIDHRIIPPLIVFHDKIMIPPVH